MTDKSNRREFLRDASILGAGLAGLGMASSVYAADQSSEKTAALSKPAATGEPFVMGIIGTGGRGQAVAAGFMATPGVRVKYLCDVDDAQLGKADKAVAKRAEKEAAKKQPGEKVEAKADEFAEPTKVKDFRRVLEDKEVHAVAVATPDHWHAPAAILACKAGKHVYVEKPCAHNPHEGELLVEAARKYNRVVQHGTQRRSWSGIIKAITAVRGGEIGNVHFARAWYASNRGSIGRGKGVPVPSTLDYALWQGPAPEQPFRDNLLHYNWHWFWHWGTGELGNNGVHFLDLARWGLGVDYPKRVTSAGGRYHFSDDQETPDTQTATFEFGDRILLWEHRSCQPRGIEGDRSGVSFHGDKGTLVLLDDGYKVFDLKDKVIDEHEEKVDSIDAAHFAAFVDAARKGSRPVADIEEGFKSTLLCHLGNIALRTGRSLAIDPKSGRIVGDSEAETKFWAREYRQGWEPTV